MRSSILSYRNLPDPTLQLYSRNLKSSISWCLGQDGTFDRFREECSHSRRLPNERLSSTDIGHDANRTIINLVPARWRPYVSKLPPWQTVHMGNRNRQAVILIHGIGEQRPMDTLRSFVEGLGEDKYYSKPDRISESHELRRYTLPSTRHRPITDCYELYWANRMDSGKFLETLWWSFKLIFCRPFWRLDQTLRSLIGSVQIAVVLLVVGLGWKLAELLVMNRAGDVWPFWLAGVAAVFLAGQLVTGRFVTESLAEAARYLTPRPRNVDARNIIREDGLRLLKRLHEEGQYDRIILVGHSLGSVIGYDLLRFAWDDLRSPIPTASTPRAQPRAKEFDKIGATLGKAPNRAEIEAFQLAQNRLWQENRSSGVPWLVTDFVTLGSPLAHASLLLDTRTVKLRQRKMEEEYPLCPPLAERGTSFINVPHIVDGESRTMRTAKHGAPFGPTRWSNLYFPTRFPLRGDPVGGPVTPEFGPGVRDVPVRLSLADWRAVACQFFFLPHTRYWSHDPQRPSADKAARKLQDRATGTQDANVMLRAVLRL